MAISKTREEYIEIFSITFLILSLSLAMLVGSWQYMFLVFVCFSYLAIINLRLDWAVFLTILLISVARFPVKTEYFEPIKYAIFFSILFIWFIKKVNSAEKNKWDYVRDNPFNKFVVLFTLLMFITLFYSIDIKTSLQAIMTHMLGFAYLYFFLDILSKKDYMNKAIFVFFFTAIFVSLIAILQYIIVQFRILTGLGRFILPTTHRQLLLYGKTELLTLGGYRSLGTLEHPNLLGIYLVTVLPIAISFLFYVKENMKRILLIFIILILSSGIFCSGSRGAFLSLIFSGIFLLIAYWKRISKSLIVACFLLIILTLSIFFRQIIEYFRLIQGVAFRNIIWQNSLDIFKEHPLMGWGIGNFPKLYLARFGLPSIYDVENVLNELELTASPKLLVGFTAHNLFLNYASEIGIFSVFLLLFFYAIYFKKFIDFLRLKRKDYDYHYIIVMGCTAAIVGNFIHSFFEATIGFNHLTTALPFVLLISMSMVSIAKHNFNYGKQ